MTSPLGFKARMGSALFALGGGVRVALHIPWDSPLVLHLLTSWQPAWLPSWSLPHTCEGIGGSQTGDLWLHERTLNRLSYAGSAITNMIFGITHLFILFHLNVVILKLFFLDRPFTRKYGLEDKPKWGYADNLWLWWHLDGISNAKGMQAWKAWHQSWTLPCC